MEINHPITQSPDHPILLDLSAPRFVSFRLAGGAEFTYRCRRIHDGDWKKYWAGGIVESERDGNAQSWSSDVSAARVQFVESVLESVEGYHLRDGRAFTALANWKSRLPAGHKVLAGQILEEVHAVPAAPEAGFDPELDEVILEAAWNGQLFSGLIHRFAPATPEQLRRFYRVQSSSRVVAVGGSPTNRTIYGNSGGVLIELYDEMIRQVDGYAVAAAPLTDCKQIAHEMDAAHKVTAVAQLFAAPVPETKATA